MFEMLMSGRQRLTGLGPGPKTLRFGDAQAGYFGTLTQAELFTPAEVYSKVGMTVGAARVDASLLWCKFYYKGEVIYIPTRPVTSDATQVSWQDLYKQGVVYGVTGPGTYPDTSGNVDQSKQISKTLEGAVARFKLRLPSASTTLDPIDQAAGNASRTGELSELMTKVVSKTVAGGATALWDAITTTNFDKISNCFVKNSGWAPSTLGAPYAVIGTTPGAYSYGGTSKSGKQPGLHWIPVLIFVP